jgi:WD40 repeat protein
MEGPTREQAAKQLGWQPSTVKSRLEQAGEWLRKLLTLRGIALSTAIGAAVIPDGAAPAAVPAFLRHSTVKASCLVGAGGTPNSAVSWNAAALTETVLKTLFLTKVKIIAAVTISVAIIGTGAGLFMQAARGPKTAETPQGQVARPMLAKVDKYGDALPAGALARFGTVRFRHGSMISSVSFTRDGTLLASRSADNSVRFWEPFTGREIRRIDVGEVLQLWSMALSPDNKTICAGGAAHSLYLFSAETGKKLLRLGFADGLGGFNSVAFSPDGRMLAAGSIVRKIGLWNAATGTLSKVLVGHEDRVSSVAFSPDGKFLASGSLDKTICLWNTTTGKPFLSLFGHKDAVNSVAFSPDGHVLASGGNDGTVGVWDIRTGKAIRPPHVLKCPVRCVSFSPNGKEVAIGMRGRGWAPNQPCDLVLWDVENGQERNRIPGPRGSVEAVCFSPDGRLLAAGTTDPAVRVWELATHRAFRLPGAPEYSILALACSPDGRVCASSAFRDIHLWDIESGKLDRTLWGHTANIHCLAFSFDGTLLASGDEGNSLRIWEVASGMELRVLEGPKYGATAVGFSPDGKTIASAGWDQEVFIWDVKTGHEIRRFQIPEAAFYPTCISWRSNEITILSGNAQGSSVWQIREGKPPRKLHNYQLLNLVEPATGGDPLTTTKVVRRSLRHQSEELAEDGHRASPASVGQLLEQEGYRLHVSRESYSGPDDAEREAQFQTCSLPHADLDQLIGWVRLVPRPIADLTAAAVHSGRQAARQHVPAEKAMIRGLARQRSWIAGQNLGTNRRQTFAKDFAYVRVTPGPADNGGDHVGVDIANRQLVQVGGEAAARLHLAPRVDNQRLPRTFTIIFLKPGPVPAARQPLGSLHRRQMVPVERHGQFRRDQKITAEQIRPLDHSSERGRQSPDRLQPLILPPACIGKRKNTVVAENRTRNAAKFGKRFRANAVKFIDTQPKLTGKTGVGKLG